MNHFLLTTPANSPCVTNVEPFYVSDISNCPIFPRRHELLLTMVFDRTYSPNLIDFPGEGRDWRGNLAEGRSHDYPLQVYKLIYTTT